MVEAVCVCVCVCARAYVSYESTAPFSLADSLKDLLKLHLNCAVKNHFTASGTSSHCPEPSVSLSLSLSPVISRFISKSQLQLLPV